MKPPVETIRLGKQARDQLTKIKRNTGIENWNIICRWALCVSIREKTPPPVAKASSDDGIEMSWKVFAGDHAELYAALVQVSKQADESNMRRNDSAFLHAHLRRGLGYLASGTETRSIEQLVAKWLGKQLNHETPTSDAKPIRRRKAASQDPSED